jgi:hypothetical protein
MQAQLVALQGRVAQLEVELAGRPLVGPVMPTGRLQEAYVAVRRERDELAMPEFYSSRTQLIEIALKYGFQRALWC